MERPKALNTVGLQNEGTLIKVAYLDYKKGKVVLQDLYSIEVSGDSSPENVNPLLLTEQGKALLRRLKQHLSFTAIGSNETLVRPLFVQLKKEKDIASVIEFQTEPILPFPQEEAVVEWLMTEKQEEGTSLLIFAVKKEHILRHLREWGMYGIDPECVSTVSLAITSFGLTFLPEEESFYIVHVGVKHTTCVLIYKRAPLAAQFTGKGFQDLLEALKKDMNCSEAEAKESLSQPGFESGKYPLFEAAKEALSLEVMKIFFGLAKQLRGEEVHKVLITGEGGAVASVRESLALELKKESLEIEIPPEFPRPKEVLLRYDVPIGLALSGLPKAPFELDLRKKELAYPNPWKRLIGPMLTYFGACLFLTWGAYMASNAFIGSKEDVLKEKFGSLLGVMNKPYNSFEATYEEIPESEKNLPLEALTPEDLSDRLNYLDAELEKAPEPIALMPNTPRVSDVLAWLASHPNVVWAGDENEGRKSLVQIQHFNYSMMKRPEEKKRGGRYEVKVELEFTSPTPKSAREFHDALIEDTTFVDTKGEIKWSSNRGLYRTSFYLVDKTFYPTTKS